MKPWHALVGTGLLAGAVFLGVAQHRQSAELARTRGEIAALSISVEEAERAGAASRGGGKIVEHRIVTVPAAAVPAAPAGTVEPSAERVERPAPPPPHVYAEHLETAFQVESADAAWSSKARSMAEERLSAAERGTVRSLECRASMCRLETGVLESGDDVQLVRSVIGEPGNDVWSGAVFSRVEEDEAGRPTRVSYLFRAGTTPPML